MAADTTGSEASSTKLNIVVSEINIFPLKSCKAVSVQSATVDKLGLSHDRRLMLVDSNNRFLHQRKFPRLATVTATLNSAGDELYLSAPDKTPLTVQICRRPCDDRPLREVAVWQSSLPAIDQGDEAALWFQSIFEASQSFARLVALPLLESETCVPRPIRYPPSFPKLPDRHLGFSDTGPVLLIAEESLADVNDKFEAGWSQAVPMSRFRPNVVISGAGGAFEEDRWLLIQIGAVPFMVLQKAEVSLDIESDD